MGRGRKNDVRQIGKDGRKALRHGLALGELNGAGNYELKTPIFVLLDNAIASEFRAAIYAQNPHSSECNAIIGGELLVDAISALV
jgi:hypothetical protein